MNQSDRKHLLDQALQLKRQKHFQQAYALFEKILSDQSPFERVDYCLSNMGHIQYLTGQYEKARQLVEKAVSANPKNWFALSVLGEIYLKQNQYDEALSAFQQAYQINSSEIYLILRLAKILQIKKNFDEAFSLLKKSILADPDQSRLYSGLGDLHSAKRDYQLARENYLKAVQLDSKNQYAFRQWISTLEAEKAPEEILNEIQKLLKLPSQKDNAFLRDYYGKILAKLGRVDESIQQLENSVKSAPRNLYRKTRLAANYNRTNQPEKVLNLLLAEDENGVVDEYLFQELATAYVQLGRNADARELLVRGLKLFPNNRTLRALLMKAR